MVVIGAGRVGRALQRLAADSGEACALVTRDEGWESLNDPPGDPVIVATRNDDLDAVVERTPSFRRSDLVFMQNGALMPWLQRARLTENTRGLLFAAIPDRTSTPALGPDPSPFTGPHALAVVRWMVRIGIPAQVVGWGQFRAWEVEKLVWNAAFGLMCDVHRCNVGLVCDEHEAELRVLVDELRQVCRAAENVDLEPEWLSDRAIAYSRTIPLYTGSVKEWPWRNGWFVTEGARRGVATPLHHRLLRQAGHGDKLPA